MKICMHAFFFVNNLYACLKQYIICCTRITSYLWKCDYTIIISNCQQITVLFINHVFFWRCEGLESIFQHRARDKKSLAKTYNEKISYHTIWIILVWYPCQMITKVSLQKKMVKYSVTNKGGMQTKHSSWISLPSWYGRECVLAGLQERGIGVHYNWKMAQVYRRQCSWP